MQISSHLKLSFIFARVGFGSGCGVTFGVQSCVFFGDVTFGGANFLGVGFWLFWLILN